MNESENIYKNIIKNNAEKAHNENRLLKLLSNKPKALQEYEEEATIQEKKILALQKLEDDK